MAEIAAEAEVAGRRRCAAISAIVTSSKPRSANNRVRDVENPLPLRVDGTLLRHWTGV